MKRLLTDNLVLTAGITLPVVLVAVFLLATWIPNWVTPAPRYDFLVANWRDGGRVDAQVSGTLKVVDGQLRLCLKKHAHGGRYRLPAKIYRVHVDTGRVETLHVDQPARAQISSDGVTIPVAVTRGLKLDDHHTAPDGYTFESASRRGSGFLADIFDDGAGRNTRYILENNGATTRLPDRINRYGTRFIAWIIPSRASDSVND